MLWITAFAAIAAQPAEAEPQPAPRVTVQARATVRIVAGTRLLLTEDRVAAQDAAATDSTIRSPDGRQTAKLVEFQ